MSIYPGIDRKEIGEKPRYLCFDIGGTFSSSRACYRVIRQVQRLTSIDQFRLKLEKFDFIGIFGTWNVSFNPNGFGLEQVMVIYTSGCRQNKKAKIYGG